MNFSSVQFHAHPLELIKIGFSLSEEFKLFCVCADQNTNSVFFINFKDEITMINSHVNSCNLMVLFEKEIAEKIDGFTKLRENQQRGIFIEVGALNEEGLRESVISFSKNDIEYKNVDPKKVVARFKKFTRTGAVSFNIKMGTSVVSKTHRYTEGAKKLHDSGVKIIPFGGGKTVFFRLP